MALGAEIPDDVETPEDRERAAALEERIGNAFPNLPRRQEKAYNRAIIDLGTSFRS